MNLTEDETTVFRGFLNLPNLQKLKIVEAINEYFDSNDREPIRAENDLRFDRLVREMNVYQCKCCGR